VKNDKLFERGTKRTPRVFPMRRCRKGAVFVISKIDLLLIQETKHGRFQKKLLVLLALQKYVERKNLWLQKKVCKKEKSEPTKEEPLLLSVMKVKYTSFFRFIQVIIVSFFSI
jgi:hypothetical protein